MPERASLVDGDGNPLRLSPTAAAALLQWYATAARDLPWRHTRDPYSILVSEIMLQQTRVDTVIDRYARFLQRFPTLPDLAAADEDAVLAEWSGLGYYRRARNLHRFARQVAASHDGELPQDYSVLLTLPGLGEYTAAAVASIAFDRPHLTIDGNVARVLCRLLAISADPTRAPVKRALRDAAQEALKAHPPSQLNQALMELGALVCLPRSPRCDECPWEGRCLARRDGLQSAIPPTRKQPIHEVQEAAAVIERAGHYLLLRGQRRGVLESMWEFPTLDSREHGAHGNGQPQVAEGVVAAATDTASALESHLRDYLIRVGCQVAALDHIGSIRHGITNRRIVCQVYRATLPEAPRLPESPGSAWFTPEAFDQIPLAASARKILQLLE